MLLAPPLRPSSPTELELPLIAAQPGIWMGDQLSATRNAFIVAQYIELNGAIDVELLRQAIRIGLSEADTVHARFVENEGRLSQILPLRRNAADLLEADVVDVSKEPDPEAAALVFMRADLAAFLPLDGDRPLYRHALIRVGETSNGARWFWYQRYHHLMVDGSALPPSRGGSPKSTRRLGAENLSGIRPSPPSPRWSKNINHTRVRRPRRRTGCFGWTTPEIFRRRSRCRRKARRLRKRRMYHCRCGVG